jgi:CheY-like chemotaxis protein
MTSTTLDDPPLSARAAPRSLIVYVEDNASNLAFMADLLTDFERVDLLTAPTAELGIELIRARRPDIVIMDINLPGMSGFEATLQLRAWPETRDTPVVALSATWTGSASTFAAAGFYCSLTKPVIVDELTQVLEELLGPSRDARDRPNDNSSRPRSGHR